MESTKSKKKLYIVVEIILFAVYILFGILQLVTTKHCVADAAIFWIGLLVAIVCAVLLGIYESKKK